MQIEINYDDLSFVMRQLHDFTVCFMLMRPNEAKRAKEILIKLNNQSQWPYYKQVKEEV